jgi:hypothetical protein
MLSDKKKASTRIAEILSYSSHFKQTVGAESRRFATGKQRQKQKHLPRINTEFHGKDTEIRTRISICHGLTRNFTEGSRSHGRKQRQKQKNLPRNFTENTLK